jgi:2-polyprenyl-6-methoxyphenol hydroxylase-like FAD-dependent oxidoreductase
MSDCRPPCSSAIGSVGVRPPSGGTAPGCRAVVSDRMGVPTGRTHEGASGHRAHRSANRARDDTDGVDSRTGAPSATRTLSDGGSEPDGRTAEGARRPRSEPDWIPTDDVITDYPDRQVLVVGDTVVGLTLALLLRHAGYDPLVVGGTGRSLPSRLAYLCPPALRTFDAIGVGTPVRSHGTAVDRVSVHGPGSPADATGLSSQPKPEGTPPLLVGTERLRHALAAQLPERKLGCDRTVETLSRRDGGLTVEFEDGVREWFDVVVDAGGGDASLRSVRDGGPAADTLTQYEIRSDADTLPREQLREHWGADAFVQQLPTPNSSRRVLRVTTPRSDVEQGIGEGGWEAVLPNGGVDVEAVARDPGAAELASRRQVRLADADAAPEWWGTNRVAFCGPAACPIAPASGFDVTFGIEDAVAFVSELTAANRPAAELVDTYSSRRARRFATLGDAVETAWSGHDYPRRGSTHPALASVRALRAVTLGSFLGTPMQSLQRDGFTAG